MDVRREREATPTKNRTEVERKSERELVVTRTVNAPKHLVFEALPSCEMDVHVGGRIGWCFPRRFDDGVLRTYLEVTPHSRLVWTNEEGDDGKTVTTVTFEETAGKTLLVVHDLYPSKEALDAGSGSSDAMPEAFDQLDELLESLGSSTETN